MSLLDDPEETVGADPQMVSQLLEAMAIALKDAVLPGVTTQADVLSATFTLLSRILASAREQDDPADRKRNAIEIGRVLGTLLMEFGAETLQ